MVEEKSCFRCQRTLPLEAFYRHPRMTDGRLGKCKECARKDVRLNRAKRREQYSRYERERGKSEERKGNKKRYARRRDRQKVRARQAVKNAIRDGRLTRPPRCESCGSSLCVQAHHDDYSKPLEVRWLCFTCHRSVHGQTVVVHSF